MLKEIIITPLATCHTYDLRKSKEAFEKLAKKEPPSFSCCGVSFFRNTFISGWVEVQYARLGCSGECIDQYKMGTLIQDENKQKAIETFKLENISNNITTRYLFLEILQTYFSSSTLEQISEAWSAAISVSDEEQKRFEKLVREATPDKPVFFTVNTNDLDVEKLLQKLLGEDMSTINVCVGDANGFIQIKPNVFICTSYLIGNYGTMQHVIHQHSEDRDKIKIILPPAQHKLKSILEGNCQISPNNFLKFDEYFTIDKAKDANVAKLKIN